MFLKVITVKNVSFVTTSLLILSSNFQDSVCNGCHDLRILFLNLSLNLCLSDTVIIIVTVDYRCIIHGISKSEAIKLLKNSVLEDHGYL